jgi:aspartyl-tRNA(Asn)/glutamyl-tRNA(Gln) amidotransferase subunit C
LPTSKQQVSITENEVTKVARLARLHLNQENIITYAQSLCNILDFVAEINNSDTSTVEPMSSPLNANLSKRADKVTETDQRSLLQGLAPQVSSGLYIVPQVIE